MENRLLYCKSELFLNHNSVSEGVGSKFITLETEPIRGL